MKQTKTLRILSFGLSFLLLSGIFSCQDQFSEKDALSAQQQVDLLIYVVDYSTSNYSPVANATVTLSQANQSYEVITDASGIASFPEMIIGDYIYTITATDFTSVTGVGQMNLLKFRQAEVTTTYGVYSLNSAQMATVKGNVTIETDVTNISPEVVANSEVFVDVFLQGGAMTFVTTTDANGDYTIQVPTDGNLATCTQVRLRYPDLEMDQTISYNKLATDPLTFPDVLPVVDGAMKTVFSMDNQFWLNSYVPPANSVRTVYAIADAAPAGGSTAVVSRVFVDNQGRIVDVSIDRGSNYPGVNTVTVTFTSLNGGSGATLIIDLAAAGGTTSLRTAYNNGFFTLTPGSGYPQEYSLNGIGFRQSGYRNTFCVASGSVNIANADYGTGIYKPIDLQ